MVFTNNKLDLRVAAQPPTSYEKAAGQLRDFLATAGIGGGTLYTAELALEEIGTNIFKYAYPPDTTAHFDLHVLLDAGSVRLVFEDEGSPFDPVAKPEPVRAQNVAEATIGGLGIQMVRKAAKEMTYARHGKTNRLEIVISRQA